MRTDARNQSFPRSARWPVPFPRRRLVVLAVISLTALAVFVPDIGQAFGLPGLRFEYIKIVVNGEAAPGTGGNFNALGQIALDEDGNFAFRGQASGFGQGLWTGEIVNPGAMQLRYGTSTPIPDGTGTFSSFGNPYMSAGAIAFSGNGSSLQRGIYSDINGPLEMIADRGTAVPGGTGDFIVFGEAWLWDGAIVFRAIGGGADGIYKWENGHLSVVASTNMAMPGGPGNFQSFGQNLGFLWGTPAYDKGITVFQGHDGAGHAGVYMEKNGVISVVADTNTPIPGGVGNFTAFDGSQQGANTCSGMVAFYGEGSGGQQGVYTYIGGVLAPAIDTSTFIDGVGGPVTVIGTQNYGFDRGKVASLGQVGGIQGVFTTLGGSPRAAVVNNDLLDGIDSFAFGTYGRSLEGHRIGFNVGSHGVIAKNAIYVAELVRDVSIAIKPGPGNSPAPINPKSRGQITVAVLSAEGFDAPSETMVPLLRFGRTGAEASLTRCNPGGEDVDGDGRDDLVCHFSTQASGFQRGDTQALLTGETTVGMRLSGASPIRTVGK